MKQRTSRRIRGVSRRIQERARELRRDMTPAERVLWGRLRNRQLEGLKFRRQHPLGRFIVDFCCAQHRLIVEVDGGVHRNQREYDEARTQVLQAHGYWVLRFSNEAVLGDVDAVLEVIAEVARG